MSGPDTPTIGPQARWYLPDCLAQVPRLLSCLDREPHSPTYGGFDRDAWSWKFRDFALGMAQTAVYPLALLWRHPFAGNPYHGNGRLLEWIGAAMERALARQHANGAIDAFAPNEFDVGPTLGVAHGVAEALRLVGEAVPAAQRARVEAGLRRACDFALAHDEAHGFISNHLALFAVALLDGTKLFGDERYRRRGAELVRRILAGQSAEGWYREYEGPDPGYESLGIFHLAVWWRRTGEADVLASLRRSVAFFSHCIHPDGSVGGGYGSRQTALYCPGGFEILAPVVPEAAVVARFLRERLDRRNVVGPVNADPPNLVPMLYTYLEACLGPGAGDAAPPPCLALEGRRAFAEAGLVLSGSGRSFAVVGGARGGVVRVFDREAGTLAYEDAGYVVESGRRVLSSARLGLGRLGDAGAADAVACESRFAEIRDEPLTPLRLVILRVLNLTVFRVPWLAGWFRRRIVARLVMARRPAPLVLRRRIAFETDGLAVRDELERTGSLRVDAVARPRAFTAVHAGSARYYLASDLRPAAGPPTAGAVEALNRHGRARLAFRVRVAPGGTLVEPVALTEELGEA